MTTVDRYLIRTFLGSYIILLLVGIALYVFSDVIVNLDEYTGEPNATALSALLKIADYHGYKLPLYFYQLGGVMMAVAASFTCAMLLRNNELTPLVAAGVPLQRLAVPILLCAVGLAAVWVVNSEVVMPALATQIAREYGDYHAANHQVRVLCVRDDRHAILKAQELHAQQGVLKGVYIIEPDAQGRPTGLIRADSAYYNDARHTWELERGSRLVLEAQPERPELGQPTRWEALDEYPFRLTPAQIQLRQSSQWAELMSFRQMNRLLETQNLPNLPAIARTRDVRFYQPLLMWIMILLAIPFFLTREPANVLVAGGKALLLAGGCFAFTFLAQSTSTESALARLAPAVPVFIFGPIAILHLANAKT
jgi:lipopolysaccharide export LptBFGC system permease protein LptF